MLIAWLKVFLLFIMIFLLGLSFHLYSELDKIYEYAKFGDTEGVLGLLHLSLWIVVLCLSATILSISIFLLGFHILAAFSRSFFSTTQ